jgi:hypothetical protein
MLAYGNHILHDHQTVRNCGARQGPTIHTLIRVRCDKAEPSKKLSWRHCCCTTTAPIGSSSGTGIRSAVSACCSCTANEQKRDTRSAPALASALHLITFIPLLSPRRLVLTHSATIAAKNLSHAPHRMKKLLLNQDPAVTTERETCALSTARH